MTKSEIIEFVRAEIGKAYLEDFRDHELVPSVVTKILTGMVSKEAVLKAVDSFTNPELVFGERASLNPQFALERAKQSIRRRIEEIE